MAFAKSWVSSKKKMILDNNYDLAIVYSKMTSLPRACQSTLICSEADDWLI